MNVFNEKRVWPNTLTQISVKNENHMLLVHAIKK